MDCEWKYVRGCVVDDVLLKMLTIPLSEDVSRWSWSVRVVSYLQDVWSGEWVDWDGWEWDVWMVWEGFRAPD